MLTSMRVLFLLLLFLVLSGIAGGWFLLFSFVSYQSPSARLSRRSGYRKKEDSAQREREKERDENDLYRCLDVKSV